MEQYEASAPLRTAVCRMMTPCLLILMMALVISSGDRQFMMEMFKEYKDHLRGRIDEIYAALDDHDANRLCRLAHNLKGISLNFSAGPLAAVALKLEELGRREDLTDAPALVAQLDAETQRLEAYLSEHLS